MSHEATNWAIKQRGIKPAAKLVLWQLCDRYHPDNGCFPSKETLAEDCEMSVRSVYDQIAILEAAGLVRVVENTHKSASGKFKSNRYILGFEADFTPANVNPSAKSAVGRTSQEPSANSRSNRGQNLPTNSVREPVREPVSLFPDQFEEFWSVVPKKVAKPAARKAFKAAAKKSKPSIIIEAMRNYAAARAGQDPTFTAHPATWLNAERWADEAPQTNSKHDPEKAARLARYQKIGGRQ